MRAIRREAEENGSGGRLVSVDLSGMSVLIAMPTHRDLPPQTVLSLLNTFSAAVAHDIQLRVLIEPGCTIVSLARSICVYRFLKTNLSKLFWIDSDMEWSPDAFLRMLALSTKADVVCGAYAGKTEPLEFYAATPGPVTMNDYGCIPFAGSGLGFSVVNRNVIEALANDAPVIDLKKDHFEGGIKHLFHDGLTEEGFFLSEDLMFFRDIGKRGFSIWCDPGIKLGHIGPKVYEGCLRDWMVEKLALEAAE